MKRRRGWRRAEPAGLGGPSISDTLGGMCTRAQCPTCNRPTYNGCGRHVEQVLGDVPTSERCECAEGPRQAEEVGAKRSWFRSRSSLSR